jgi:excisionase family DNA binding protein
MNLAGAFEVFTIDDLSNYLRISRSTLYKLAKAKQLPGQKVGRHWRFHKEAIDSWLKNKNTNFFQTLETGRGSEGPSATN